MNALRGKLEDLVLFLFGGEGAANREAELGAIKADPVGFVEEGRFGIRQLADVGQQRERSAVERDGRKIHGLRELGLVGVELALQTIILSTDRLVGVNED